MEGMLENLTGEGLTALEILMGGGLWTEKYILRGRLSISSMFQSLQSISFQKIVLPIQILLFFQTTDRTTEFTENLDHVLITNFSTRWVL